jgi:hypothetical protein
LRGQIDWRKSNHALDRVLGNVGGRVVLAVMTSDGESERPSAAI